MLQLLSAELERSYVGAVLVHPVWLDDLSVPVDAVCDPHAQTVYAAIMRLYNLGRPVSFSSVANEVMADGLSQDDAILVVRDCDESRAFSIDEVRDHVSVIMSAWKIRQLAELGKSLVNRSVIGADIPNLIDSISSVLDDIEGRGINDIIAGGDLAHNLRDELLSPPKTRPIQTRIQTLNDLIGGFQNGDYIVIAAPSSSGKTAFSMDILKWNRIGGHNSLYICLDQNPRSLMQREYQALTGMDQRQISRADGDFNDYQKQAINQAYMEYIGDPGTIFFYDNACASVSDIRATVRSMIRKNNIKLVVIDHIQQILSSGKPESRNAEMSDISRRLKALALECDIPIIALSQLNRGYDSAERTNWNWTFPRIKKDHLRDSGMIGADATTIITILNKPAYIGERFGWESPEMKLEKARYGEDQWGCELSVLKNKNGKDGSIKCIFNPKRMQFYSPTPGQPENDPKERRESEDGHGKVGLL